ncbi:MAG: peptidoglycan DD-metalloendopeptidase family protein [Actinobacteria bacterium]|nr:peptidoglycan DD-metalloendopeptidase family protein [Actinomycetota bacterium]
MKRSRRARVGLSAVVLAFAVSAFVVGGEIIPAGYRPPVKVDGVVFPVARADWLSVINFTDDWHAPRMRLVGKRWVQSGIHEGTDILAEPGTPIRAMTAGEVENLGWLFYSGWRVGIRGDDGSYYFYAHMTEFAPGLSTGDEVSAGETIGFVGNTGYGTKEGHHDEFIYHLHVGIQEPDGRWINPFPLLEDLYREAVETDR